MRLESTDAVVLPLAPHVQSAATEQPPLRLEDVYEEHFDFVWRSLRRLGVAPSQLDDAAQDVFLVVHRRLADFVPRASIKTWLFGICLRVASDYRRRVRRTGGLMFFSSGQVSAPEEQGPFESALRAEASQLILDFLESLDERKRAIFILMEMEQMSAAETARALGVNQRTVYSRIREARRRFSRWANNLRKKKQGGDHG